MGKRKKKYYAVARGHKPGIYDTWLGDGGAEIQIRGCSNALHRGFHSLIDAENWFRQNSDMEPTRWFKGGDGEEHNAGEESDSDSLKDTGRVRVYTDGGCVENPGRGGYGVVTISGTHRKELYGGFRFTTNNRMELMACIAGLSSLSPDLPVTVYTDSRYVVNGITKGWARKWRANGWKRSKTARAENADLWSKLLDLCDKYPVDFVWIKGHGGNPENERCDTLARQSALGEELFTDDAYESGNTTIGEPSLFD